VKEGGKKEKKKKEREREEREREEKTGTIFFLFWGVFVFLRSFVSIVFQNNSVNNSVCVNGCLWLSHKPLQKKKEEEE